MTESDHDADGLSAPEEDMIRMLVARNLLELDKRCWFLNNN